MLPKLQSSPGHTPPAHDAAGSPKPQVSLNMDHSLIKCPFGQCLECTIPIICLLRAAHRWGKYKNKSKLKHLHVPPRGLVQSNGLDGAAEREMQNAGSNTRLFPGQRVQEERMTLTLSHFPTALPGGVGYGRPGNRIRPRNTHGLILTAERQEEGQGGHRNCLVKKAPARRDCSARVLLPGPPRLSTEAGASSEAGDHLGSPRA